MDASPFGLDTGTQWSRRKIIRSTLAGSFAALGAGSPTTIQGESLTVPPPRAPAFSLAPPLRFAHMTDQHIYGDPRAETGFAAALEKLSRLDPAPSFIVTGGDHIMDSFSSGRSDAEAQWDVYLRLLTAHIDLPTFALLGNHDILGWGNPNASSADRGYGKALAMDRLALDRTYYSLDAGDWHFIFLDNISRRGNHYCAALDDVQTEWLIDDLRQAGTLTPLCVVTHVPLLAACALFDTGVAQEKGYSVSDSSLHPRVGELLKIFSPPGAAPYNLRLCVSGHIHMVDRVEYLGKTFICGGAVSGNWWQGPYHSHPPGFSIFDLWADGSFKHEYVTY